MQTTLDLYNYNLKSIRKQSQDFYKTGQPTCSISSTDNIERNVYILLMASSISDIWSFSWFHCSGFREIPTRHLKHSIKLCLRPQLKTTKSIKHPSFQVLEPDVQTMCTLVKEEYAVKMCAPLHPSDQTYTVLAETAAGATLRYIKCHSEAHL